MSNDDRGVLGEKIDELRCINCKNNDDLTSILILTVDFPRNIKLDVNSGTRCVAIKLALPVPVAPMTL
jgi:hypothetical protein